MWVWDFVACTWNILVQNWKIFSFFIPNTLLDHQILQSSRLPSEKDSFCWAFSDSSIFQFLFLCCLGILLFARTMETKWMLIYTGKFAWFLIACQNEVTSVANELSPANSMPVCLKRNLAWNALTRPSRPPHRAHKSCWRMTAACCCSTGLTFHSPKETLVLLCNKAVLQGLLARCG